MQQNLGAVSDALGVVARAHAGDEDHALGNGAVGGPLEHAAGGAGGGDQALKLQRVDHVFVLAVAVLAVAAQRGLVLLLGDLVERVAGGHDDSAHALFRELFLVVEVDGLGLALLGADFAALAALQPGAVLGVDHRPGRHCLGERDIDGGAVTHSEIEFAWVLLERTVVPAVAAARALAHVDVARLLPDLDLEIADETFDRLDLGVAVELDAGMLPHFHHARRQDALRAVERGEGFRQPGHLAADRGLALHQHHFVTGIGDVERRLDAGHPGADDHGAPRHRNLDGSQGAVVAHLLHRHADDLGSLAGGGRAVVVHPGAVLANVGHLHQVGIQTGSLGGLAKGLQVHVRRAGSHHHAIQVLGGDLLPDDVLSRIGAQVFVIDRTDDAWKGRYPLADLVHVYRARYVLTAPAGKYADSGHINVPIPGWPAPLALAGARAQAFPEVLARAWA